MEPTDLGKPRLRGRLHQYAFFVALVCGIVLSSIAWSRPGISPFLSCVIYSATVCGLFGISALYHRRAWSERGYQIMKRMDHSMIFIFIAGTYTPFCVELLSPGKATLVLLLIGGAVYSIGAVFYALRRPNPWPTVFGHHEFFHACTLVAAISHHIAIYFALYAS
jgi:hemolysin III